MASVRNRISERSKTLDHKEAADFLKIDEGTLYNWVNAKKIAVIKMGRKNVYRESDLIHFMEERLVDADPQR